MYEEAGLDLALAEALYRVEWQPEARPWYPDVLDTFQAVNGWGAKIAAISDITSTSDLSASPRGFDAFTGAYVLSCELGIQKPDPQIEYSVSPVQLTEPEPFRAGLRIPLMARSPPPVHPPIITSLSHVRAD